MSLDRPTCCVQALGILVQLEGVKFGRRVASVLPLIAACLHKGVGWMEQDQDMTDAGQEEAESAVTGWQEVYACLLLLEKLHHLLPSQVSEPSPLDMCARDTGVQLHQRLSVWRMSGLCRKADSALPGCGADQKCWDVEDVAARESMPDCCV